MKWIATSGKMNRNNDFQKSLRTVISIASRLYWKWRCAETFEAHMPFCKNTWKCSKLESNHIVPFSVIRFLTKSFLLFIFLAIGFPSYSQLWLTGGMDIHRYTDTGPMDLKDEPIYPTVRMGFDIYAPKEKKLGFGGELALIGRRFSQELSGYDFEYRFRGMQALVYMQYRITSEIYIDAGLSGAFFGSSLRRNGNRKRMASGFRSHDVGWAVGGGYHISNRFSVGYRFTQWKIEMLEYRIIDDLGYFGPNQRAILASNHLIYLRFHLISLDL